MRIEKTTVIRLEISDVPRLDPIRVYLEDIGPSQGRINIECYGKAWSSYWGGMGDRSIAAFFCSSDEHYLAGKLSNIPDSVFDPGVLVEKARHRILFDRKAGYISKSNAREQYDGAERLAEIKDEPMARENSATLTELFGEDWHCDMPTKPNPDYTYLCRIIKAVQAALKEQST